MSRQIDKNDSYQNRLLKLIPSEVVAVFLAIEAIFKSNSNDVIYDPMYFGTEVDHVGKVVWFIFCFLIIVTPLHLCFLQDVKRPIQLLFSTITFGVWVYSIGGPFALSGYYEPRISASLLMMWTLLIPLVLKKKSKELRSDLDGEI